MEYKTFSKIKHKNLYIKLQFDEKLSKLIYAASDFIIIPSKFEPCGLTQLIALKHGSIPIVSKTGGHADTISSKNGYIFKNQNSKDMKKQIDKAINDFYKNRLLKKINFGLKEDFSWNNSSKKYIEIYDFLQHKK